MASGDILMKLEGTKSGWIKGEVKYKERDDWIEVESVSASISSPGSFQQGSGGGSQAPQFGDIVISKLADASTVPVIDSSAHSEHFKKITIEHRKGSGGNALPFLTVTIENARISGHSLSTASGGSQHETYSFNFEKVTYSYQPQDEKGGKKGGAKDAVIDLTKRGK